MKKTMKKTKKLAPEVSEALSELHSMITAPREVIARDCENISEINRAFRLDIGTDIDKMYAITTGMYKCPSFEDEPSRITAPLDSSNYWRANHAQQRFSKYDFERETESKASSRPSLATNPPWVSRFSPATAVKTQSTAKQIEGAGKIVVNIPKGWIVTMNGEQVILEAPKA